MCETDRHYIAKSVNVRVKTGFAFGTFGCAFRAELSRRAGLAGFQGNGTGGILERSCWAGVTGFGIVHEVITAQWEFPTGSTGFLRSWQSQQT